MMVQGCTGSVRWLTNSSTSLQVTEQLLQQEGATPGTQVLQDAEACSCA